MSGETKRKRTQDSAKSAQPRLLLTAREVADRLGVGQRTVWRWTLEGNIPPPVRQGRVVRWRSADIQRYVELLPAQKRPAL